MENRTWKATTAGILNIIAGIVSLFAGIDLIVGIGIVTKLTGSLMNIPGFMGVFFLVGIYVILAGIILGIIAIVGGVFALKRKNGGWCLRDPSALFCIYLPGSWGYRQSYLLSWVRASSNRVPGIKACNVSLVPALLFCDLD